jgi:hypothetical protein
MQTSRFQLGLIATLAVGLGFSLASSEAVGYPAGAAVSMGTNPIVSNGGALNDGSSTPLFTAPIDQDLIITDIILTSHSNMECKRAHRTELSVVSGGVLAHFMTSSTTSRQYYDYDSSSGGSVQHTFGSGLRVLAGETVNMAVFQAATQGSGCGSPGSYGVHYAISGYYARP